MKSVTVSIAGTSKLVSFDPREIAAFVAEEDADGPEPCIFILYFRGGHELTVDVTPDPKQRWREARLEFIEMLQHALDSPHA